MTLEEIRKYINQTTINTNPAVVSSMVEAYSEEHGGGELPSGGKNGDMLVYRKQEPYYELKEQYTREEIEANLLSAELAEIVSDEAYLDGYPVVLFTIPDEETGPAIICLTPAEDDVYYYYLPEESDLGIAGWVMFSGDGPIKKKPDVKFYERDPWIQIINRVPELFANQLNAFTKIEGHEGLEYTNVFGKDAGEGKFLTYRGPRTAASFKEEYTTDELRAAGVEEGGEIWSVLMSRFENELIVGEDSLFIVTYYPEPEYPEAWSILYAESTNDSRYEFYYEPATGVSDWNVVPENVDYNALKHCLAIIEEECPQMAKVLTIKEEKEGFAWDFIESPEPPAQTELVVTITKRPKSVDTPLEKIYAALRDGTPVRAYYIDSYYGQLLSTRVCLGDDGFGVYFDFISQVQFSEDNVYMRIVKIYMKQDNQFTEDYGVVTLQSEPR